MVRLAKRSGRSFGWVFIFLFVLALLGILGFRLLNQDGNGNAKVPFSQPPNFTLNLFDGYGWEGKNEIGPAAAKGQILVVNFWASWCLPCRDEAPVLQKLSQEYAAQGVIFLGVAYQDRQEDSLAFLKRFGITYPNGPDTTGEISIEYGTTGIPETWFIGADGTVRYKYIRPLTEPVLRNFLELLVHDTPKGN